MKTLYVRAGFDIGNNASKLAIEVEGSAAPAKSLVLVPSCYQATQQPAQVGLGEFGELSGSIALRGDSESPVFITISDDVGKHKTSVLESGDKGSQFERVLSLLAAHLAIVNYQNTVRMPSEVRFQLAVSAIDADTKLKIEESIAKTHSTQFLYGGSQHLIRWSVDRLEVLAEGVQFFVADPHLALTKPCLDVGFGTAINARFEHSDQLHITREVEDLGFIRCLEKIAESELYQDVMRKAKLTGSAHFLRAIETNSQTFQGVPIERFFKGISRPYCQRLRQFSDLTQSHGQILVSGGVWDIAALRRPLQSVFPAAVPLSHVMPKKKGRQPKRKGFDAQERFTTAKLLLIYLRDHEIN